MYLIKFRSLLIVVSLCAVATDILASSILSQPQTQESEKEAIRNTFSQYRKALLEGDGSKAVEWIDTRTISFYDEVVKNALAMSQQELKQLDFTAKFMVLRVRHEFSKSQIEKMNGRELFKAGIEKRWVSAMASNIDRLHRIVIEIHKASASVPQDPDAPSFFFLKESGQWKMALWQDIEFLNVMMKSKVKESGLTEEAFIMKSIDILSSKKVDERILSGPLE